MNPTIDISSLQSNVKHRYNYLVTDFFQKKEKYENYRYRWAGDGRTERVPYQATRTTIIKGGATE